MKKILWLSDTPTVHTGMGRVTAETGKLLLSRYEMVYGGWNIEDRDRYRGIEINEPNIPFHVYSIRKACQEEKDDVFRIIEKEQPDIIVFFGDQWDFWYNKEIYAKYPNIFTICYVNVDSGPVSQAHAERFRFYDRIIVSSEYAKNELKQLIPTRDIRVSYHGVNVDDYFPVNKETVRQEFGINNETFVLGYIARNQVRKNIPAIIDIYSKFQKNKEDVLFVLVTDINNKNHNTIDIVSLIKRNIPTNKIKVIETRPSKPFTNAYMNRMINTFDVYTSTSYAEGQGMPIQESMRCGVIPIVPDAYCMREIVKNGILVPVSGHVVLEGERKFSIVDEEKYLQSLETLYIMRKMKDERYNKLKESVITCSFDFNWIELASSIDEEIKIAIIEGKDTCVTASVFG